MKRCGIQMWQQRKKKYFFTEISQHIFCRYDFLCGERYVEFCWSTDNAHCIRKRDKVFVSMKSKSKLQHMTTRDRIEHINCNCAALIKLKNLF